MNRLARLGLAFVLVLALGATTAFAGGPRAKRDAARSVTSAVITPGVTETGTLAEMDNADYYITLAAGDTLSASLDGPVDADFTLVLFDDATNEMVAVSEFGGIGEYPEAFDYYVETAGTYRISVEQFQGSGDFTLYYEIEPAFVGAPDDDIPGVAVPASPIVDTLNDVDDFDDVYSVYLKAGQVITANLSGDGGTDFDLYLYGPSAVSISVDPLMFSAGDTSTETLVYVVKTSGTYYMDAYASNGAGAYTLAYTVQTAAIVSNPVAPDLMYASKYYSVWGTIKPRHTAGSYPVRIYKYRYVNGAWVSYGYQRCIASNYLTYSKYAQTIRLPYAGRWRLRAYAPADALHPAQLSPGFDYVTVK